MAKTTDKTGFNQVGFRPVANQIALILSEDDLQILGSAYAPRKKVEKVSKPKIVGADKKPAIIVPEEEEALQQAEKDNRTFTVAAVAKGLVDNDGPQVGDEVSLLSGTMQELKVDGKVYGVIPAHRVLAIHKTKIN
jgi:co-chaperonin GroES (HSP10)